MAAVKEDAALARVHAEQRRATSAMEFFLTKTEKWWAMNCTECGGFVPIRIIQASEREPPALAGRANCVRCNASNMLEHAALFVIDGTRLRRIRLSAPADYVK